jgi:hypothetical protein
MRNCPSASTEATIAPVGGSGTKQTNGTVTNAGHIQWEGNGDPRLLGMLYNLPGALRGLRNSEGLNPRDQPLHAMPYDVTPN